MANTLILSSVVEGAPIITTVTITKTLAVPNGYYTAGQVIDSTLLGTPDILNILVNLGAIQILDPVLAGSTLLSARPVTYAAATLVTSTATSTSP